MSRSIRVLHVDDDDALLDLTKTMLEREHDDIVVETEPDVEVALSQLDADTRFDCIVSDYDMPRMDGLTFLSAVQERHLDLPFILFTGKGSEEIASRAISAGVTEYLQKGGGTDRYLVLANRIENAVDKHRAERERRRNRERYQALIEYSSDSVAILDEEGVFEYVSPSAEQILGYRPEVLLDRNSFEFVHPEDRETVELAFQRCLDDPDVRPSTTYRFEHGDGSWRVLESRATNRRDDPAVEGFVVNTRDVTKQHEAEQRLKEERELFDAALDALPDTFYVSHPDGTAWRWNQTLKDLMGYTEQEMRELPPEAFFAEEDHEKIESVIQRVHDGETVVYEARVLTKSGEKIPKRISATLLTDDDGEPLALCGIGVDTDFRPENLD
ncbi:PAS domain S-box protein [Haloarchaeobius sp. HME9146]|uniref:PAS domain-containing response regulator n=1 Tax=Haloarchaeobius sp. HME9146 TaxID=2978732 RepID=UPI0021BE1CEF|nr:PAS domain S-box protein [Haloarchaeobius sp. HME9146]MCT9097161.1 PAS domain S-box protein [Haloarchaeobius sp. HME9146]